MLNILPVFPAFFPETQAQHTVDRLKPNAYENIEIQASATNVYDTPGPSSCQENSLGEGAYTVMNSATPCHPHLGLQMLNSSTVSGTGGSSTSGTATVQFGRLSISSSDNSRYVVTEANCSER